MSIIDITAATVRNEGPDYNKFDFTKTEPNKRILIPTTNIAQAFVHSIYRSEGYLVTDDKGRSKMEWDQGSYAGTYHCTGDFNKVNSARSYGDPDNCPACKAMHEDPKVVSPPRKQFALNVLEYTTAPNGREVKSDNVTVKLWKHGNDKNISPIQTALAETGAKINHLDFLIECVELTYKKLQITFSERPAYAKDDPAYNKERLKENIANAIANDLYDNDALLAALGEKVTADQLRNEVKAAVSMASAGSSNGNDAMFVAEVPETNGSGDKAADDLTQVSAADIDSLL